MSKYFLQVLDKNGNPITEFDPLPIEDNGKGTIEETIESFTYDDMQNGYAASYDFDYEIAIESIHTDVDKNKDGHYDARLIVDKTYFNLYKFKVVEVE